jgi:hypothetical protein
VLIPRLQDLSAWKRVLAMGIWGKIVLYKYISVWMITEGVCITNGREHLFLGSELLNISFLIHQG